MVNNQIKQIKTMTQELQQVTAYVKAFGDPSKLLNIVGANQLIGSLHQTGVGQTLTQLQRSANGIQALQYNGNGLYQSLGQTFTTPDGTQVPRLEDLYRKYGAIQDDSRNFQSVTTTCSRGAKLCATKSLQRHKSFKRQQRTRKRRSSTACSPATTPNWEQ